ATKSGAIEIGFLDRFSGTLVITGDVSSIESSLEAIMQYLKASLNFSVTNISRS
ncbi:MAG: BMC domain-containing protein, partial [Cetobacterium sp.]